MKPEDDTPVARTGDLCLLAEGPALPATLEFQRKLQERFGGVFTDRLHLTLQRFTPFEGARGGEKCHLHGFVRVDGILATDLHLQNNGDSGSLPPALFD